MKKLFQRVSIFFISTYFLSQKVFAQILVTPDYGIVPEVEATGSSTARILLVVVLPIIVVVAIVTGIVIYIKRKKKKSIAQGNIQNGKT
jgi:membrane protein DedA with SNARE-associated domain